MHGQVYSLWILFLAVSYSQSGTINLQEPADSTIFALQRGLNRIDATIKYDVSNLEGPNAQICMQLDNTDSKEQLLQSTCFAATGETKTLMDLPIGNFLLSMLLRESVPPYSIFENSRVASSFRVASIEELLPKIDLSGTIIKFSGNESVEQNLNEIVVAAVVGDLTDVPVEYELSSSALKMDGFDMFVRLIDLKSNESLLQPTFITTNQRRLTFRSMNIGSYKIFLSLAHHSDINAVDVKNEIYGSSEVELLIHIKPLDTDEIMPKLHILNDLENVDLKLDSKNEQKNVKIDFTMEGLPSAVALVQTCVSVNKYNLNIQIVEEIVEINSDNADYLALKQRSDEILLNCLVPEERSVIIQLGEGSYDIKLFLQLIEKPNLFFKSSSVQHSRITLNSPEERKKVIEEHSETKNIIGTFFQTITSFPVKTKANCNENEIEKVNDDDEISFPTKYSFIKTLWEMVRFPPATSDLKYAFHHLSSKLIPILTLVPNPVIIASNLKKQTILQTRMLIDFDFIPNFEFTRFYCLISSICNFLKILMELSVKEIKCCFLKLCYFFDNDFVIENLTPYEFFHKSAQIYFLFFIVIIVYFIVSVIFNKKNIFEILK